MRNPTISDCVVLLQDIPEMGLHAGEIGIIRSALRSPQRAYEVEFQPLGRQDSTCALLAPDRIALQPPSPFDDLPEMDGRSLYF